MRKVVPAGAAVLVLSISASAQTPAGPEFRVNTYTTSGQSNASAAMEPDGDFVVAWTSYGADGDALGVFGQRFAASGTPVGGEFPINTYTTGWQRNPAVAMGARGDMVVVWVNDETQPGSGARITGRRFDGSGSASGGEFAISASFTTANLETPRVGRAADGRFVVLWTGLNDGSGKGIAARRFDASGAPVGAEFVVNTYTTGEQSHGDVAVGADGSFVAVWQDLNGRDGSSWGIFGQRHDAAGNRLGGEFLVNTYTTGRQEAPSLSVSPAGGFVVAWTSRGGGDGSGYAVFSRRFDADGNGLGSDFVVNTYTTGYQYGSFGQVAHDSAGNFVVAWRGRAEGDSRAASAQRFAATGSRRGAEFRANTYTTNGQDLTAVVSDAAGNFVVVWQSDQQDGSSHGVYAQRFGGLGPAALAVDTAANGVLEPGETVDVRPSWRNLNGAAQAISAGLAGIAGPPGAVHAITDSVGDYGTVADGAVAACADCYAVSVSDPAPRPALHWDASAVESLVPDAQGQQKRWLLHVGRSFADVPPTSPFYRFVEALLHHGVTGGCAAAAYCPAHTTSREQMAVFVLAAREGAGYAPPPCGATPAFADVPASSPYCRWIEELARRGVVGGCGPGSYCPTSPVTREQMAVFVLRTLDAALSPPACAAPMFADVPATSPYCRWIEELSRRGAVTGCGGGNYCPGLPVTREQMGVFLGVTFGLALYGP